MLRFNYRHELELVAAQQLAGDHTHLQRRHFLACVCVRVCACVYACVHVSVYVCGNLQDTSTICDA